LKLVHQNTERKRTVGTPAGDDDIAPLSSAVMMGKAPR